MASSLTRSSISYRRQGSSGFLWRESWIAGVTDGSGRSARVLNNNVHAAGDSGFSQNMLRLPESSTKQVLLRSGSLGSNPTPPSVTVYRRDGHRTRRMEITSTGATKKTKSRFIRWAKRAFWKCSGWS